MSLTGVCKHMMSCLHILVKLVDIRTDTQIWAERYSRDLSVQNIGYYSGRYC
jgi:TolB-like protein